MAKNRSEKTLSSMAKTAQWIGPGIIATSSLLTASIHANPVGPDVIAGQVSIKHPSTNVLEITNSPGAIVNWQGFSVEKNEITKFIQQNQQSAILNRVVGGLPSEILGQIQSNGRVFLINPNGVLFGQNAVIDTAALVTSTLGLSNNDFLSGHLQFNSREEAAGIRNEGTLLAKNHIVLIAPDVENTGTITVENGNVLLAAGESVLLADIQNPQVTFEVQAGGGEVRNLGEITAHSGSIDMFADTLVHSGDLSVASTNMGEGGAIRLIASDQLTVSANAVVNADGIDGGSIRIESLSGTSLVSGSVHARGTTGKGGEISILGENVALLDQAIIDASGNTGGGVVWVGGQWQGGNEHQAKNTYVGSETTISASALGRGDGGTVAVWSTEQTLALGNINATGGSAGGNGGQVETSSLGYLQLGSNAPDVSASFGQAGQWLLDPTNISIVSAAEAASAAISVIPVDDSDVFDLFASSPGLSLVNVDLITAALNAGTDVTIQTTADAGSQGGDIFVDTAISFSAAASNQGGTTQLHLEAAGELIISNAITNTGSDAFLLKLSAGTVNLIDDVNVAASIDVGINGRVEVDGYLLVENGDVVLINNDVKINRGSLDLFGQLTIAGALTQTNPVLDVVNTIGGLGVLNLTSETQISSLGDVQLSGGDINISGTGAAAALQIENLTLDVFSSNIVGGQVEISDNFEWIAGSLEGGKTFLKNGATATVSTILDKKLTNHKITVQSGASLEFINSEVEVLASQLVVDTGGSAKFTASNKFTDSDKVVAPVISILSNGALNFDSKSGIIEGIDDITLNAGAMTVADNGEVDFMSLSINGDATLTLEEGASIFGNSLTVNGTNETTESVLVKSGAEIDLAISAALLTLNEGIIDNAGEIYVAGDFSFNGGTLKGAGETEVAMSEATWSGGPSPTNVTSGTGGSAGSGEFDEMSMFGTFGNIRFGGPKNKTIKQQLVTVTGGSSTFNGSGNLVLDDGANLTFGGDSDAASAVFLVGGTSFTTNITTTNSGTLTIGPSAVYQVSGLDFIHNIGVTLVNQGTLAVFGSGSTAINLTEGGAHTGTFLSGSESVSINFTGGTHTFTGDSLFTGTGAITLDSTIDGASFNIGGENSLAGLRIESNSFDFSSATLLGKGVLSIGAFDPNLEAVKKDSADTVVNFSGVNNFVNGTVFVRNRGQLSLNNNQAGDVSLTAKGFVNNGQLYLSSGGGPSSVGLQNVSLSVTGSGGLVNNGLLVIDDTAGEFNSGVGGTRTISALLNNFGTVNVSTSTTVSAVEGSHLNRGDINVFGGNLIFDFSGAGGTTREFRHERGTIASGSAGFSITNTSTDGIIRSGTGPMTLLNFVTGTAANTAFNNADFDGTLVRVNNGNTAVFITGSDLSEDTNGTEAGLVLLGSGQFIVDGNVTIAELLSVEGGATVDFSSSSNTTFDLTGVLNIEDGEINLFTATAGTASYKGIINVSEDGTLNITNGEHTFDGATLGGGGTINLIQEVVDSADTLIVDFDNDTSIDSVPTFRGPGEIVQTTLRVSDVDLDGTNGSITNNGILAFAGNSTVEVAIENNGLVQISPNNAVTPEGLSAPELDTLISFQNAFVNNGRFELNRNLGPMTRLSEARFNNINSIAPSFSNNGTVEISAGTVKISGGAAFDDSVVTFDSFGNLDLDGAVSFSGSNIVSGTGSLDIFDAVVSFSGTTALGADADLTFVSFIDTSFINVSEGEDIGRLVNFGSVEVEGDVNFSGVDFVNRNSLTIYNSAADPNIVTFGNLESEGSITTDKREPDNEGLLAVNVLGEFDTSDADGEDLALTIKTGMVSLTGGGILGGRVEIGDDAFSGLILRDSNFEFADGLNFDVEGVAPGPTEQGLVVIRDALIDVAGLGQRTTLDQVEFQIINSDFTGEGAIRINASSNVFIAGEVGIDTVVLNLGNLTVDADLNNGSPTTLVDFNNNVFNGGTVQVGSVSSVNAATVNFNGKFEELFREELFDLTTDPTAMFVNNGTVNLLGGGSYFREFEVGEASTLNFSGGTFGFFDGTGFKKTDLAATGGVVNFNGSAKVNFESNNGTNVSSDSTLIFDGVTGDGDGRLTSIGVVIFKGVNDLSDTLLSNLSTPSGTSGVIEFDSSEGDVALTIDALENNSGARVSFVGANLTTLTVLDGNDGDTEDSGAGFTNEGDIEVSGGGRALIVGDFTSGFESSIDVTNSRLELTISNTNSDISGIVNVTGSNSEFAIVQSGSSLFTIMDAEFTVGEGAFLTVDGGELVFSDLRRREVFTDTSLGNFVLNNVAVSGASQSIDLVDTNLDLEGNTSLRLLNFEYAASTVTIEENASVFFNSVDFDNEAGGGSFNIDGVLTIGGSSKIEGDLSLSGQLIQNDAIVRLIGGGTISGDVSLSGKSSLSILSSVVTLNAAQFLINDSSNLNLTVGSLFANGSTLSSTTSSGTVSLLTGAMLTLSGVNSWDSVNVSSNNLTVSGTGSLQLGNATLAGVTTLESDATIEAIAGTLSEIDSFLINGNLNLQNASVQAVSLDLVGGTLSGAGTIQGNLNNTSGLVSPGMSPGSLSVLGNFTQGFEGILRLELGGKNQESEQLSDSFSVSGDAAFDGKLELVALNGYTQDNAPNFQPLLVSGSVTGDFSEVEVSDQRANQDLVSVELTFDASQESEFVSTVFSDVPVVDEPVVDEPVVDEPVVDEPVVDEPVVDEPVVDEPVVDEPVVDESTPGDPLAGLVPDDQKEKANDQLQKGTDQISRDSKGAEETSSCLKTNEDSPEGGGGGDKDDKSADQGGEQAEAGPAGGHGAGCGTS